MNYLIRRLFGPWHSPIQRCLGALLITAFAQALEGLSIAMGDELGDNASYQFSRVEPSAWEFVHGFSLSKKPARVDDRDYIDVKTAGIRLTGAQFTKFSPVRGQRIIRGSAMAKLLRFGVSGYSIGLGLPIVPLEEAESYSVFFYLRNNSTKSDKPIKILLNNFPGSIPVTSSQNTNWRKVGPFEFSLDQQNSTTEPTHGVSKKAQSTTIKLIGPDGHPVNLAAIEVYVKRRRRPTPTPSLTPTAVQPESPTPASSPTQAPTSTLTPTAAPTASSTPTRLTTATPTATRTPIATATRTPTTTPATTATPTSTPNPGGHPYTRFPYLEGRSLSDPPVARFIAYVNSVRAGGSTNGFEPYYYVYAKLLTGDQSYCVDAVSDTQTAVNAAMFDINAGRPPADLVYNSYLYAGGIIQNLMVVLDHCIGVMSQQQVSTWSRLAAETAYNLRVGFHDDAHYTRTNGPRVNANFSGWPFGNQANNYTYQHNRVFAYAGIVLQASHPQVRTWLMQERIATLAAFLELMYATNSTGQVTSGGGSFEGHDYGAFAVWTAHIAGLLKDSGFLIPGSFGLWAQAHAQSLAHMMLPSSSDFISHSLIGSGARDKWAGYEDLDLHHVLEILRLLNPEGEAARVLRYVMRRSRTRYASLANRSYYTYNSANDLLYSDGPEQLPGVVWVSPGAGYLSARSSWIGTASHLFAWVGGLWEESHLAGTDIRGHIQLFANNAYQLDNGDQLAGGPTDIQNYHNILRFPGRTQNDEPGSISSTVLPGGEIQVTMNMSNCYDTAVNWVRTLTYNPTGRELIIRDTWNQGVVSTATARFAVANATVSGGTAAILNAGSARFDVISGGTLSISSITGGKLLNIAASGGVVEYKVSW